jgi:hypothetical protein
MAKSPELAVRDAEEELAGKVQEKVDQVERVLQAAEPAINLPPKD